MGPSSIVRPLKSKIPITEMIPSFHKGEKQLPQRSKHAMTGFSAYGSHLAEISVGKAAVVPRVCGSPPGTLVADRIPFLVVGGLKSPFTYRFFAT